ncbi:MAG: hypothetical protein RJQ04_20785 [Longimicrobiales bacterium]
MLFRKLELDWKYGLSELLIVVTGVLIALAADGWVDSRADRALERQYIAGVMRDLQSDTAQIREAIALSDRRAASARDVLAEIEGETRLSPDELAIAVEESMWFNFPAYSRETITDLMSTGNLRLVRDSHLRQRLSEYYQAIDRLDQWTGNWRRIQMDLEALLPNVLELRHRDAITSRINDVPLLPWAVELDVTPEESEAIRRRLREHDSIGERLENMARVHGTFYSHLQRIHALGVAALRAAEAA